MTEPSYTAADAILHIAACVELLRNEIQQVREALPETVTARDLADHVITRLDGLFAKVTEHQATHGAHGDVYSSGVPVASVVDLAGGHRWQRAWHPAPEYPSNTPRTLVAGIRLPDGSMADVISPAVGVLDVVRRPSPNVV